MTRKKSLLVRLMRLIAPRTAAERDQFRVAVVRGQREAKRLARSAHDLETFAAKRRS